MHIPFSEDIFKDLFLFFHQEDPRGWTKVLKLGKKKKSLYLLGHLTGPCFIFKTKKSHAVKAAFELAM